MDGVLDHPIVATVAAAVILAVLATVYRWARDVAGYLRELAEWVLPHFRPEVDERGVADHSRTMPARVDALTKSTEDVAQKLLDHMGEEERLRTEDLERAAAFEAKVDDVIDQLRAGNPEVRAR